MSIVVIFGEITGALFPSLYFSMLSKFSTKGHVLTFPLRWKRSIFIYFENKQTLGHISLRGIRVPFIIQQGSLLTELS